MKRKSFLIHIDSLDILDDLTREQKGELFDAIKAYQLGEEIELSQIVKIAFSPFKNQFNRDDDKYTKTCKSRAIAGSKGGKQKVANASKCKQDAANVAENDSDSKSDNKNKTKRFKPPSIDEVDSYIIEKQYSVNAGQWMSHYESNGWKVGKNAMKDWKAAVRTWENRNKQDEKTGYKSKANTAAAVGRLFEEEGRAAAIRLSQGADGEVQSDFSSEMGRDVQDGRTSIIEHE